MQTLKTDGRSWALIWACLLAVGGAGLYAPSPRVDLSLIFLTITGMVLLSAEKMQARLIDWSLLLIAVFEVLSLTFSPYRANGISSAWNIVLVLLVFFAVRLTFQTSLQMVCFATVLGIGDAWLGLDGLHHFTLETQRLTEAGFSNLLAFRSRLILPPAPWIPGEWFTVVLLGLPFACAVPLYLWRRGKSWSAIVALLPPLIVTAALMLSLSRAVFWSTFLFYLVATGLLFFSQTISLRTAGLLLASVAGGLALILACETAIYPGIVTAYAGQHTSQTRSTQGRLGIWSRSLELVREHPLMGVGASNAALSLLSSADDEETTGFASRTFSLPVQILVEKGVLGFLLYGTVLVAVACKAWRTLRSPSNIPSPPTKKGVGGKVKENSGAVIEDVFQGEAAYKAMVCCFAAGLIAVLFRELTYSSLMEHSLTIVLFAALAALVCRPEVA